MISKTFDNLFCILSNFVCIWPTWLFYKDNNKHLDWDLAFKSSEKDPLRC